MNHFAAICVCGSSPLKKCDSGNKMSAQPADVCVQTKECLYHLSWSTLYSALSLEPFQLSSCVKCCHEHGQAFAREKVDMVLQWCLLVRCKHTKYSSRAPFGLWMVQPMPWHQLVSDAAGYRDRTTTVPAWSPRSEQAKADSGISFSESHEKPNLCLSRETTLKCHRAPNGKNNLGSKKVRRHSG